MGIYRKFVRAQSERNPSIRNLVKFLDDDEVEQSACKFAALEFFSDLSIPRDRVLDAGEIAAYLKSPWTHKGRVKGLGRMLLIEDLSKDVIETLGSVLNLDPLFFASHLHSPWPEISTQTPDLAMLPSRARPDKYLSIHYHRTIVFRDTGLSPRQLLRISNVHRKVVVLPKTKKVCLGFAQHCCSIFKTVLKDKTWMCIVLVDPPIGNAYYSVKNGRKGLLDLNMQSTPFLGGYEDFLDPPSMNDGPFCASGPGRSHLRSDLIYYWQRLRPDFFNAESPSLLELAYYPMRIIAAEWVNYLTVMHHSIKQYEYTIEELPALFEEHGRLNSDLRSLQSWRRRSMSSQQKLRSTARFIRSSSSVPFTSYSNLGAMPWYQLLAQDYDHLASSVNDFGNRFEHMLPVVTSMVQIADSRRSFAETKNVSRLTYLALVFVPLTFTTGLFSMNSDVGPGSQKFWMFFAVSIPLTIGVFLVAQPPVKKAKAAVEHLRELQLRFSNLSNNVSLAGRVVESAELYPFPTLVEANGRTPDLERDYVRGREETISTL